MRARAALGAACVGLGTWFGAATSAPPALAQLQGEGEAEAVSPPRPGKADDSAPIVLTYLVGILLIGAAVGANLIPSKRGHQD